MAGYHGTVKSFNPQRGWGFIECPETYEAYGKDIFVMKSQLPGGSAEKGDQVTFQVMQGISGPEATQVAFAVERPWSRGASGGPRGAIGAIGAIGGSASSAASGNASYVGTVKSYSAQKGWGFVMSDTLQKLYGKDLFFMKTGLTSGSVSPGDQVRFSVIQGIKGPEATNLQPAAQPAGARRRAVGAGLSTGGGASGGRPGAARGSSVPPWVAAPAALPAPAQQRPPPWQAISQPPPWASPQQQHHRAPEVHFGTVKSFGEERGWGHISCDLTFQTYGKDVFLMRSALAGQTVHPGTLVSFKVAYDPKGPQATDVSVLPDGSFGTGGSSGYFFTGTVKSFNTDKGWGFVTSDEVQQVFGKDIFLHRLELNGLVPSPGDSVQFSVEPGNTGQLEAKNVAFGSAAEGYQPVRGGGGWPGDGGRSKPY